MFDPVTDRGDGVWGPVLEVGAARRAVAGGDRLRVLPRAAERTGHAVEEEQSLVPGETPTGLQQVGPHGPQHLCWA